MSATLVRRDVELALSSDRVPRDWYAEDPYLSAFIAALSLVFPRGEAFFVESVRRLRDTVRDPDLAAEVAAFVGQEAMHAREHRALNRLIAAHAPEAVARSDAEVAQILAAARRLLGPRGRLAVTCALEHLTATLAEQLLRPGPIQASIHPEVRPLWLWHALEELEHRAVAHDVYRAAGGGYARRVAAMALAGAGLAYALARIHRRLLAADPRPRTLGVRARGLAHLWGRPGPLRRLVAAGVAYLDPRYDPARRDVAALVEEYRARLFGPGGALAAA